MIILKALTVSSLVIALQVYSTWAYISEVQLISERDDIIEGTGSVTLQCTAIESYVDQYRDTRAAFYRDGTRVRSDINHVIDEGTKKLRISPLQRSDSGTYTCNLLDQESSSENKPYKLNVLYHPSGVEIQGCGGVAEKGKGLQLRCLVSDPGNPPVTQYRWYSSQYDVKEKRKDVTVYPGRQGEIVYTCEATSSLASAKATCKVNVQEPPSVKTLNQTVALDSLTSAEVALECVGQGHQLEVGWRNQGQPLKQKQYYRTLNEKLGTTGYISTLTWTVQFESLTCKDAEELAGPFQCVVNGKLGDQDKQDISEDIWADFKYPPLWDEEVPRMYEVSMGDENVVLTCAVCASPQPNMENVRWRHNGRDLTHLPNVSIDHQGRLTIGKVTRTYLGTYSCSMDNPLAVRHNVRGIDKVTSEFIIQLNEKDPSSSTSCAVIAVVSCLAVILVGGLICLIKTGKIKINRQATFPFITHVSVFGWDVMGRAPESDSAETSRGANPSRVYPPMEPKSPDNGPYQHHNGKDKGKEIGDESHPCVSAESIPSKACEVDMTDMDNTVNTSKEDKDSHSDEESTLIENDASIVEMSGENLNKTTDHLLQDHDA